MKLVVMTAGEPGLQLLQHLTTRPDVEVCSVITSPGAAEYRAYERCCERWGFPIAATLGPAAIFDVLLILCWLQDLPLEFLRRFNFGGVWLRPGDPIGLESSGNGPSSSGRGLSVVAYRISEKGLGVPLAQFWSYPHQDPLGSIGMGAAITRNKITRLYGPLTDLALAALAANL